MFSIDPIKTVLCIPGVSAVIKGTLVWHFIWHNSFLDNIDATLRIILILKYEYSLIFAPVGDNHFALGGGQTFMLELVMVTMMLMRRRRWIKHLWSLMLKPQHLILNPKPSNLNPQFWIINHQSSIIIPSFLIVHSQSANLKRKSSILHP